MMRKNHVIRALPLFVAAAFVLALLPVWSGCQKEAGPSSADPSSQETGILSSAPAPGNNDHQAVFSSAEGEAAVAAVDRRTLDRFGERSFEGTGMPLKDAEKETPEEYQRLIYLPGMTADGPDRTNSIIGADGRTRVNPTTTYPARAIALVTFTGGRCTGWLYGKNVVATAGHCVHSGGTTGAWRTNVRAYPGRNGGSSPYGSCTARWLASVVGWVTNKLETYDYGVIKLNCTIGNTTGWFGYWWQSASLSGLTTRVDGYPGDKPLEQWRSTDYVRATETRQVFYRNDTVGGNSGGPVFKYRGAGSPFCVGYCSMAIHAYGLHGTGNHASNNHGTRITQAVFNNLQAWKAAP